ncbi:MAG: DUF3024 domain-containing protein [Ktedonobacterales bacterium]
MTKRQKEWVFSPSRSLTPKPHVPEALKTEVTTRANEVVEKILKPRHVQLPSDNQQFNYIIDIFTRWYHSYFYFCSTYACPGPNALSPTFESRFARMEYVGNSRFALAYMRYTGQWLELYPSLSLDECLRAMSEEGHFQP